MLVSLPLITQADGQSRIIREVRGTHGRSGYELFRASTRSKHDFNVIALIDQRDPFGAGWQRVKVVRDANGTIFKAVLSPIKMQGVQSIDDGSVWKTMLPDERLVIYQPSPSGQDLQSSHRLSLAKRNYTFRVSGTTRVAGRECYRLDVSPRYRELASWTLYLDSATTYPLRMDSSQEGSSRVEFISRAVSFPSRIDPSLIEFDIPEGFKTMRSDRPETLSSARDAERELGFLPYIPEELPLGFKVQDMQVSKTNGWKALVFRLSDGMARASVYEYLIRQGNSDVKPFENSTIATIGEIQLMLVSDAAQECRARLLKCFAKKVSQEK